MENKIHTSLTEISDHAADALFPVEFPVAIIEDDTDGINKKEAADAK